MANTSDSRQYQINTCVWLNELSRQLGRPATLDDIADRELDHLAELGVDWVWLLSVWRTGEASRDMKWTLQQQGFDHTYDKRLYDRMRDGHAGPVRDHLHAGIDFQNKLDLPHSQWRLRDLLGSARYDRRGDDLETPGLYLDLAPWRYHVFSLKKLR